MVGEATITALGTGEEQVQDTAVVVRAMGVDTRRKNTEEATAGRVKNMANAMKRKRAMKAMEDLDLMGVVSGNTMIYLYLITS